jgi:hypothetical protein
MSHINFEIRQGNSYRVVGWQFPFDITGSEIVLTIKWPGGSIEKSTSDGGLAVEGTEINGVAVPIVYWTPTVAESREIPIGPVARYEIERRVPGGEQRTYVEGFVIGKSGVNND